MQENVLLLVYHMKSRIGEEQAKEWSRYVQGGPGSWMRAAPLSPPKTMLWNKHGPTLC